MATKSESIKHLEAILGYKLTAEAVEQIGLFLLAASSTSPAGSTTMKSIFAGRPNRCFQDQYLDVYGVATTGSDGKSRFLLTDFICPPGKNFGPPINVVATPLSSTPCYLTVLHSLVKVNNREDLEIQVSTWDANGAAAPSVSFDWRCRVTLPSVVS